MVTGFLDPKASRQTLSHCFTISLMLSLSSSMPPTSALALGQSQDMVELVVMAEERDP